MQVQKPLTRRRKEVLTLILKFMAERGHSPSLKEIASLLGTDNVSTAQYFVDELDARGYLKKGSRQERVITPISEPTTVPLLGLIAAGAPIEPLENAEDVLVPGNFNIDKRYPHYALKIKGDSMIDMGILDGDIVLIRHQLTAENGDVVVAVTEKGATLKVYRKRGGNIVLEPRNKDYPLIIPQKLEVRGKFVGLIREGV
jgi:repressor LexA